METSMSVPMVDPPVLSMQLADKRTLTWQEFGDPVGRPALYFHGGGSASFEAGIFHREALASGLRLISTNRPGAGGTSLCDGRPVAAYSDDVAELLDHLRIDRCACFGESNGGMVTLAIASRLSARILGAVPINPTLPWFDPLARLVSSRAVGFAYWTLKHAPWAFGLGLQKTVAKYRRIKSAPYTMTPTLNSPELFGPPPGTEEDVGEILWKVLMQVNSRSKRPELRWATHDWGFDYYNIPVELDFFCGVRDAQAPFALVLADRNPRGRFHYFSYGHHGFAHPAARRRIVESISRYYAE
jgi:pimeloyl-ACP methyl ester carboxylesterase